MNCPTTRCSTPAAAPRIGPGFSALPRQDPGAKTQSLPFAALPHELRKDPRLKGNRTAIVLAAALLEYARARDSCWPSNRRLAEDLGCCQQTVRNALAALQAAGWVRVEHGASNPTGRVIWLTWRAGRIIPPAPSNRLDLPLKTAGEPPLKTVGPEPRIVVVEEREESPKIACERSRPETPPTLIPAPEYPAAPTLLRTQPGVSDCRPDSSSGAPPIPQPGAAEPLTSISQEPALPPRAGSPPPLPALPTPQTEVGPRAACPTLGTPPALLTPGPAPGPTTALPSWPRAEVAYPALRTPPAWSLPAPSPRPGPASLPLTPELSVAAPAPVVVPPQSQSPTLRKLGLGPRAAHPALKTPPAGSPAPSPVLPLTPEQQAKLAAMPAASRDQVLLWLATGDPILVAEARKKLAPLRPHLEAPKTLPELLGRIREDPSYPALAASGLAAALQDQKSYSGYLRRCEEAWRGELNPDRLLSAYEQAMDPKARNRGAIFMVAVKRRE